MFILLLENEKRGRKRGEREIGQDWEETKDKEMEKEEGRGIGMFPSKNMIQRVAIMSRWHHILAILRGGQTFLDYPQKRNEKTCIGSHCKEEHIFT